MASDLGQIFALETKVRTKVHRRLCSEDGERIRQRETAESNTNSNRNEETKDHFTFPIGKADAAPLAPCSHDLQKTPAPKPPTWLQTETKTAPVIRSKSSNQTISQMTPQTTAPLKIKEMQRMANQAVPQSSSEPVPRSKTVPQSASLANCSFRDIVIFASKQIYERGFEALNLCYFDFGLDVAELVTLANLFNDVDGDKDGRLGINDIANWVSSHGGSMDSQAAAEAIKSVKHEGGFLSKLDFVRLILEREMEGRGERGGEGGGAGEQDTAKEENVIIKQDGLLWAAFIALDANRDGWVSVEDFRRLCRSMDYDLDENAVKSTVGKVGKFGFRGCVSYGGGCVGRSGGGGSGGGMDGLSMNYCEFKKFLESGRNVKVRENSKLCVIQ